MKRQTKKVVAALAVCTLSAVALLASSCAFTEKIEQLRCDHVWNEGEVTVEATCTEKGEKTLTCELCEATTTEELPTIAHTEVTVPAVAPTCAEPGFTEGVKCSECDEVIVEPEAIPALGHVEYELESKAPDCINDGYTAMIICYDCGTLLQDSEPIPALGHFYQESYYNEYMQYCVECHEERIAPLIADAWSSEEGMTFTADKQYRFAQAFMVKNKYVMPETISVNFKLDAVPTKNEYVFGNYESEDAGYPHFNLRINNQGYFVFWYKNSWVDENGEVKSDKAKTAVFNDEKAKVITDGEYHTYTFVFSDAGRIHIAIDGVSVGVSRTNVFAPEPATTMPFAVGSNYTKDGVFSGTMKYLLMYADERTAEEIAQDHIFATNTDPDLLAYLDFTEPYREVSVFNFADESNILWAVEEEEPVCEHTYDLGEHYQPYACVTGSYTYTCTLCGEKKVEELGPTDEHHIVPATCETPEICEVCGESCGPALGHDWGFDGSCTRCGMI